MQTFSIGSSKYTDFIRERLDIQFRSLWAQGWKGDLEEKQFGKYTFVGCHIDGADGKLLPLIAKAVTETIVLKWQEYLIKQIIKNHYYYFNEKERDDIQQRASKLLSTTNASTRIPLCPQRDELIYKKTIDYLKEDGHLIIEGFIRFRLREYWNELEAAVGEAVDDFLLEKEYNEFIRLLKYFVDIQEPRVERVHVVLHSSGTFQLFDDRDNLINHDYLEGFTVDLVDNEINYEDLLISALITIAPRQVVLHLSERAKTCTTIKTIKNVFGENVSICSGCSKFAHTKQRKF